MKPEILYSVKAQRGPTLRCKGWKQESLLRMLENNMENAEAPERLVIYGGIGKCRAQLGELPRHRRLPQGSGKQRDAGHPIGHAGRDLQDAPAGAARRDGQHQHHEGHLGGFLRPPGQKPDDVRPVHRGAVGVYRHAGGDPGHFRDAGCGGRSALRRLARRPDLLHRGPGRHGPQPAARDDHARRRLRGGRRQPGDHPARARPRLPGRAGGLPRRRDRAGRGRQGRRPRPGDRRLRQRGRGVPGGAGDGLAARHHLRDVPVPRPALLYPRRPDPGRGGRAARHGPWAVPGEGSRVNETPASRR